MNRWPPRPRLSRDYYKAHGLGNDYLVIEEGGDWTASEAAVSRVCDAHRGVGSDGVVVLLAGRQGGTFRLRMFNPDGGEFERSGNGLRVLGSYLARRGEAGPYAVSVGGGLVSLTVHAGDGRHHDISVEMGRARTGPEAVAMDIGVLDAEGRFPGPAGEALLVVPVSVGNPHLVVVTDEVSEERLGELGPYLVAHPAFADGANVQLATAAGPDRCRALIWERGVGPTSASGTSACAVAAALFSNGQIEPGPVTVEMPGGELRVDVSADLDLVLRGPVEEVCEGRLTQAFLDAVADMQR